MNVKEYREQVAAKLGAASRSAGGAVSFAAPESPEQTWKTALGQLSKPSSPADVRKGALQILQAGTFLGHEFDSVRAEYTDALRRAATDPDPEIRRYALDILIGNKDDFVRQKLTDGLQGKAEALLPPAAALALLARDDHSSASAIALDLLRNSPDTATRAQAVRVLGSDPAATDLLSDIMRNKDESREVRRAGAVALRGLNPQRFQDGAVAILSDDSDFPEIKSTVGGALERSGVLLNPVRSGNE